MNTKITWIVQPDLEKNGHKVTTRIDHSVPGWWSLVGDLLPTVGTWTEEEARATALQHLPYPEASPAVVAETMAAEAEIVAERAEAAA